MFNKIKGILNNLFTNYSVPTNVVEKEFETKHNIEHKELPFEVIVQTKQTRKEQSENLENPLVPYFISYAHDEYEESFKEERYEKEGRPMSKAAYEEAFKKHISVKAFLNEKKTSYLSKIWKDALYLKTVFEPLKKLNIPYTLDLTGGSVRDFVLDRPQLIKDLDFMVSIQLLAGEIPDLRELKVFSDEELNRVGWPQTLLSGVKYAGLHFEYTTDKNSLGQEDIDLMNINNPDFLKVRLLQLCFNRAAEEVQCWDHSDKRSIVVGENNYGADLFRQDRLISVFKTDGKRTNYPLDILLTDFPKTKFLNDFDFDICKASFCFINPHVKKEFPKNNSHLISRFVATVDFWADVINKTITYNVVSRSKYQIDVSFEKHLPSIEKKYEDYKLLVVGDDQHRDYLDKKLFARNLDQSMKKNSEETPKRKNKI